MADRYLLESGSPDGYLLEDGTGVLLLDLPAQISLTDNFDDNSTSASWVTGAPLASASVGGTVAETNQRVEVTPPSSTVGNNYNGYTTATTYDLRGTRTFVKVSNVAGMSGNEDVFLAFGFNVSNFCEFLAEGSSLIAKSVIAGAATLPLIATYSSTTHVWWGFRVSPDGATVYLETAPSTASNPPVEGDWSIFYTLPADASWTVATALVSFGAGTFASTASPNVIQFDGFNTATVGTVTHATTGALTGPGSTIAGTAAHIAIHGTSGVLTGPGSTVAGTAAHIAVHGTTGALIGPSSTIVGSAARTAVHTTTGVLTGPGSTIAGVAVYNAKHTTTGVLTGAGSVVVGVAARTRAHSTTGTVVGPGSTIAGTAVYNAKHTTSGALTGPGSTVAGTAARFRAFATSGVLIGPGSTIVGAALRGIISTTHATSGALVGQPSIILGTAGRMRQHATSGVLIGPSATVFGYANRSRAHDSSGAILGVTGVVFGRAFNGTPQLHDIPVDSDNLADEPASPSAILDTITEPSGQIVNHPPYPPA